MDNSIGIYIHVPFCKSKCFYCDFNSYSGKEKLAGPYFNTLFSEIKGRSRIIGDRPVKTIFIGGGTPSFVEPHYISELLELCSKFFKIDAGAEISMESNPGTMDIEKLKLYRKAGINRLSIGLQAWQDRLLSLIGRIHTKQQYVENFEAAAEAGFDNINTDLIFGLPEQSFEDWQETLENVIRLGSKKGLKHLSCYSLQIEEGTEFGRCFDEGLLKPVDDELDRRMYRYAVDFLNGNGFKQYEISNFSEPGFECRHNLIYWKAREYAGFGAGAHSYLNKMRFSDPVDIIEYINWVNKNINMLKEYKIRVGRGTDGVNGNLDCVGVNTDNVNGNRDRWNSNADRVNVNSLDASSDVDHCNSKPCIVTQNTESKEVMPEQTSYININAEKEISEMFNEDASWKPQGEIEYIGKTEAMSEYMILGLRLTEGISSSEFEERFGVSLQMVYGDKLTKLIREGLMDVSRETKEMDGFERSKGHQDSVTGFEQSKGNQDSMDCRSRYRLTRMGLDMANKAFVEFI